MARETEDNMQNPLAAGSEATRADQNFLHRFLSGPVVGSAVAVTVDCSRARTSTRFGNDADDEDATATGAHIDAQQGGNVTRRDEDVVVERGIRLSSFISCHGNIRPYLSMESGPEH